MRFKYISLKFRPKYFGVPFLKAFWSIQIWLRYWLQYKFIVFHSAFMQNRKVMVHSGKFEGVNEFCQPCKNKQKGQGYNSCLMNGSALNHSSCLKLMTKVLYLCVCRFSQRPSDWILEKLGAPIRSLQLCGQDIHIYTNT